MPIDPEFLSMLICPETHKPLRRAEPAELDQVNKLIGEGVARNRGGESVSEPLQEGLVPDGEAVVYPVRDEIPILLRQEAILLEPASSGPSEGEGAP